MPTTTAEQFADRLRAAVLTTETQAPHGRHRARRRGAQPLSGPVGGTDVFLDRLRNALD